MSGFFPHYGTQQNVCSPTSTVYSVPAHPSVLMFNNSGPNDAFVEIGGTATVPTVGGAPGSFPVWNNGRTVFIDKGNATQIAYICRAAESASVFVTQGTMT